MTNAHEDAERPGSEHEDAQSSDAAEARETESAGAESAEAEPAEAEPAEARPDDEPGVEPIAVAPVPEAPASAGSKKAPQVARVVASVALLAAIAAGIGVASGWGAPSQPLSIAPSTSYSYGASASATDTTTEAGASTKAESTTSEPTTVAPETTEPGPALDITTASSITVLVNKRIPLDPADFAPDDLVYMNEINVASINQHALRHDAAFAVRDLFAAAAEAGHVLDMTSGYRDYDLQTDLYEGYVEEQGQESADSTSARPGYSEHQTGLAADFSAPDSDPFCILDECFGETAAGQWLAENAWQYGFILRYPEGETAITGYAYEPWHFRFIGVDAAADFHESGHATYEEFVGADAAPDYE